jgi:hypothetical protein
VTADRSLAESLAECERGLEGLVRRQLRADDLEERHQRGGIEEVHADHALRRRRGRGDLRHRQRRRVRRQHRVGSADALELGEESLLGGELLDDRLDHEVASSDVGEIRREREAGKRVVARFLFQLALLDLAGEEMRDPVAGPLGKLERDFTADRLDARLRAQLRDAGSHRAQPDHADTANLPRHHASLLRDPSA